MSDNERRSNINTVANIYWRRMGTRTMKSIFFIIIALAITGCGTLKGVDKQQNPQCDAVQTASQSDPSQMGVKYNFTGANIGTVILESPWAYGVYRTEPKGRKQDRQLPQPVASKTMDEAAEVAEHLEQMKAYFGDN